MRTSHLGGGLIAILLTASAGAQCAILVRETFRLGDRPHGGNGRVRNASIHDTLKDYWPEIAAGSRWISGDGSGPTWAFAASSLDPAEIDAADPYNGTAFGEAPAAALLPFTPEPGPFTVSAEAVMGSGSTSATYLGLTSSSAVLSNFETFGTLWMSLNGRGEWAIMANGSQIVASGQADVAGTLDSGWLHMEFTFDPAAHTVSGRVMNTLIPAAPVTLTRAIAYVGMEAHESWNVVNNLIVHNGSDLDLTVSSPSAACAGSTVSLTASTNASGPWDIHWLDQYGWPLTDGPREDGSFISGSLTTQLTISGLSKLDRGMYSCEVANQCGLSRLMRIVFAVQDCTPCPADFNQDGGIDGSDIDAFFAAWEAGDSAADTNADGGVDGSDIATFFAGWEAGGC